MPSKLRKVTGLWQNTKKDSEEVYFSGRLQTSGVKVYVYKNLYRRKGRRDPDYYLWIEREASFPGERVESKRNVPLDRDEEKREEFHDRIPFPTDEDAPLEPEENDYGDEDPPM